MAAIIETFTGSANAGTPNRPAVQMAIEIAQKAANAYLARKTMRRTDVTVAAQTIFIEQGTTYTHIITIVYDDEKVSGS